MHVATFILDWIQHHLPPFWAVALAAVILVWLEHAARGRKMRHYDGWWFNNLRRSDLKFLRRPRLSRRVRRFP